MATQHPDNAYAPFWERNGDGFVGVSEELGECMSCFEELGVREFMWDWEGKYTDEAVIDKMFTTYHEYFRKRKLGKEVFLTFRIPNVWHEKGYSLIRALMVILTSEDFAKDMKFHSPPLFEVILPMTEYPRELLYIQKVFCELARFKSKVFDHSSHRNSDELEMIPLFEGVGIQTGIKIFLEQYVKQYAKFFHRRPSHLRPFIARSDPAMASGLPATVLANKIALWDSVLFSRASGIPTFPILGVGTLPFRGGLNPSDLKPFLKQNSGVRTVTIQSAFRYDYALPVVQKAIRSLNAFLPRGRAQEVRAVDRPILLRLIKKFESRYQAHLSGLIAMMGPVFAATPRRRERRLHTGLLAYQRRVGNTHLPRAIGFTCGFYSLGVPPEFIGTGSVLSELSNEERRCVSRYYPALNDDMIRAGRFLNSDNLMRLVRRDSAWKSVIGDVEGIERVLGVRLGPKTRNEHMHLNLTSTALLLLRHKPELQKVISESAKIRRSLG